MIVELWMLLGAVLLGLGHIGAASFAFKVQAGNAYTIGARDADLRPRGRAGRLDRALRNFLETFPLFAACVLLVEATGASGPLSAGGSALYLAGRAAYLPLYAAGVPWWRTLSWAVATLGLVATGGAVVAHVA